MTLWQQTWFVQLIVLVVGGVVLFLARANRIKRTAAEQLMNEEQLRASEAQRRLENWSTVPIMAFGILSLIIRVDERTGFKLSHILYGALSLAVYARFIYKWNRVDP